MATERMEEIGRLVDQAAGAMEAELRDEVYAAVGQDETRAVRYYAERLPDGDWTLDELVDAIRGEARGEP